MEPDVLSMLSQPV